MATNKKSKMRTATRKKPKRSGVSLHVYIEPELRDALDVLVDREERGLTAEVARALKMYLADQGVWRPKTEQSHA